LFFLFRFRLRSSLFFPSFFSTSTFFTSPPLPPPQQLFTASERDDLDVPFLRRAFGMLQRWGDFAKRLVELDDEEEEAREKAREEGGAAATEGEESSSSSSASSASSVPPPSELLWGDLRASFPDSLDDFGSLADFHSGVLSWARSLEEEASAALGGVVDLGLGLGGENGNGNGNDDDEEEEEEENSRRRGGSSSSSSSATLAKSLVSAARASRDLGVRARVKAALRVRRRPTAAAAEEEDKEESGASKEEGDGDRNRQPTLAFPAHHSNPPKLARAAWRDPRVTLVLFALSAIAELPDAAHDEALATLLLKKLSDLPSVRRS
jgi:hypothetical protein